jgi:hypothetical protein
MLTTSFPRASSSSRLTTSVVPPAFPHPPTLQKWLGNWGAVCTLPVSAPSSRAPSARTHLLSRQVASTSLAPPRHAGYRQRGRAEQRTNGGRCPLRRLSPGRQARVYVHPSPSPPTPGPVPPGPANGSVHPQARVSSGPHWRAGPARSGFSVAGCGYRGRVGRHGPLAAHRDQVAPRAVNPGQALVTGEEGRDSELQVNSESNGPATHACMPRPVRVCYLDLNRRLIRVRPAVITLRLPDTLLPSRPGPRRATPPAA